MTKSDHAKMSTKIDQYIILFWYKNQALIFKIIHDTKNTQKTTAQPRKQEENLYGIFSRSHPGPGTMETQ